MRAMRILPVVLLCRTARRLPRRANQLFLLPRLAPDRRGVSRSSQTLDAGCDGRIGIAGRAILMRTAKACGPGPPTLGSSPWTIFAGDGGNKARFTGESTPYAVTPSCRECRMISAHL